jgi:hypothetical protein
MFLRRDELARPAQARAGRAAAAATTIAVDGQDREFTLVAADDLWAAAADHDGLRLLVLASKTRPEKVRLKAVSG